jgi:hypothetical protein
MLRHILAHYVKTVIHKYHVHRFMTKTCISLMKRSLLHDLSKFSRVETSAFAYVDKHYKDVDYGSDEYFEKLEKIREALNHHYMLNTHHPEHYDGIYDMAILDIIEMLCDWAAVSSDLERSLNVSRDRFGYGVYLDEKFKEFFKEIGKL